MTDSLVQRVLTESAFRSMISNYRPIPPECGPAGNWLQEAGYRYFRMLKFLEGQGPFNRVVDVGSYPGTLLRLLRNTYPSVELWGLGLGLDDLRLSLADPLTRLLEVNLDPDVYFSGYTVTPIKWDIADNSIDVVFATEVIEHLYNPYQMLKEAARVLAPGGLLYLTTDNISNIGAVLSMVRGDSPNGPLQSSTVVDQPKRNWRGHVRLYSRRELVEIVGAVGLKVIAVRQFFNKKWYSMGGTYGALEMWMRNHLLWLVPARYRGHHELVARKPNLPRPS